MFKKLNPNKMLIQAREQGKKRSPFMQLLVYFVVTIIINIVMSVLLFPALFYLFYSNDKLAALLNTTTIDYNAINTQAIDILNNLPHWMTIYSLFLSVIMIIVPILYCKFIEKRSVSTMGFRKGQVFSESITGLAIGALMAVVVGGLCIAFKAVSFDGIAQFNAGTISISFVGYLIRGFAVQTIVHGYLMVSLYKNTNIKYALVISSLAMSISFTAGAQFTWTNYINMFIMGLLSGIYIIKRGNIWGAGFMYAAWSFVNDIVLNFSGTQNSVKLLNFTATKNFDALNGGSIGVEAGLISTLVLFLALGAVLFSKQNSREEIIEENTENIEV